MIYISHAEISLGGTNVKQNLSKCGAELRNSLLAEKAGLDDFEISVTESGKPYIKDNPNVCFNISHSGNIAVCAVMCNDFYINIGIDIEIISENVRFKSIANRYFTESELSALAESGDDLCEFFTTWTRKESYLKCTGQGLSGGLKSVDTKNPYVVVPPCGDIPPRREKDGLEYVFETFTVYDSLKNSYIMSICRPKDEVVYSSI